MDRGFLEIIVLAVIAAVIFRQLFLILGRKSGNEQDRPQSIANRQANGLPQRGGAAQPRTPVEAEPLTSPQNNAYFDTSDEELVKALNELKSVDRNFEPRHFVDGARLAYEMIVVAFAAGDKRALKPLLVKEVYENFEAVIDDRANRQESVELTFVGVKSAKIIAGALKGRLMEVTVRFVGELISVTKNSDGAVIEGDPTSVYDVTDVWTFSRDSRSSDPNWQLVGTTTN